MYIYIFLYRYIHIHIYIHTQQISFFSCTWILYVLEYKPLDIISLIMPHLDLCLSNIDLGLHQIFWTCLNYCFYLQGLQP